MPKKRLWDRCVYIVNSSMVRWGKSVYGFLAKLFRVYKHPTFSLVFPRHTPPSPHSIYRIPQSVLKCFSPQSTTPITMSTLKKNTIVMTVPQKPAQKGTL